MYPTPFRVLYKKEIDSPCCLGGSHRLSLIYFHSVAVERYYAHPCFIIVLVLLG